MTTDTSKQNPRLQEPERVFRHRMPVQLRFNDIDILGHLNNSVYMELFDLAKVNYFETVRPDWHDWNEVNVVIANINCDFLVPTFLHDHVEVLTAVTHLGHKSLTLEQRLVDASSGQVKSVCRTVMVGFDVAAGHTTEILPVWVEAFRNYEGPAL